MIRSFQRGVTHTDIRTTSPMQASSSRQQELNAMREALASQTGSVAQLGQLLEGAPEGLIPLPIGRVPSAASLKGKGAGTTVTSLTQMAANTFLPPLLPPAAEDLLSLGGEDDDAAAMVAAKRFYTTDPSRKRDSERAPSRDRSRPHVPSPVGPAEEPLSSKLGQIQSTVNVPPPTVGIVESTGLTQGELTT